MNVLFEQLRSMVEPEFWYELARRKLGEFKLDESPKILNASFKTGSISGVPAYMYLGSNSFGINEIPPPLSHIVPGTLWNTNTLNGFKKLNKNEIFNLEVLKIWESIEDNSALKEPTKLWRFLLLTYADIKKYKFIYWFAFPALSIPLEYIEETKLIDKEFAKKIKKKNPKESVFCIKEVGEEIIIKPLIEYEKSDYIAFADPSSLKKHPSWLLRNLAVLIGRKFGPQIVKFIAFRENLQSCENSLIFSVKIPKVTEIPKASGWEKNKRGKTTPRRIDLSEQMAPEKLAENAVDLNLKLIRWRLVPSLNLEIIKETKCLLFGAGTLGCSVSRLLLAWGFRNITFIDNGKVSHSNPVRQWLFNFEDVGKFKALAASEGLKKILPTINSKGYVITIPMPGHPSEDSEEDVNLISELIQSHNVIFLLTDTRESRWLPSMLCAKYDIPVLNLALGFDTFLAMRHGVKTDETGGRNLGCYFCNDIVAPTDSLTDRSLDMQCTVTRPAASPLAAAYGVEMLVACLHHPLKFKALPDTRDSSHSEQSVLGHVPHQVRGQISNLQVHLIHGQQFVQCVACSEKVQEAFEEEGYDFLKLVFSDPQHLEELTGLDKLQKETEELIVHWDNSDEDSENEDGFCSKCITIGISGPSRSGKTTLALELSNLLNVNIINQDAFFDITKIQKLKNNWELVESLNNKELVKYIKKLKKKSKGSLLIVEGFRLFIPKIIPLLDKMIYINITREVCYERRMRTKRVPEFYFNDILWPAQEDYEKEIKSKKFYKKVLEIDGDSLNSEEILEIVLNFINEK